MAPSELLEGVVGKLLPLVQLLLIMVCHVVTQVLITSHWAAVVCWRLTNCTRPLIFISHQDKENVEFEKKKNNPANRQRTKKEGKHSKIKTRHTFCVLLRLPWEQQSYKSLLCCLKIEHEAAKFIIHSLLFLGSSCLTWLTLVSVPFSVTIFVVVVSIRYTRKSQFYYIKEYWRI